MSRRGRAANRPQECIGRDGTNTPERWPSTGVGRVLCGPVPDTRPAAGSPPVSVRLATLARGVQVLAVTHAPQVAARADHHYLITKDALEKGKRVATRVTELAAERRREEVARMLAGAEITNEARAAAERLIKAAS